jgi:hypothetical protein
VKPFDLKRGIRVYDRWWPNRRGVVTKVLKTRVHIQWWDGEVWSYDLAHMQFLEKCRRPVVGRA